jgi:ELWxxDGT repeat protein
MPLQFLIRSSWLALIALPASGAPRQIADVNTLPEHLGVYPSEITVVGNRIFYTAQTPVQGRELWQTDGTESGTRMVKDLRVGQAGSSPGMLRAVGDRVFFLADDGEHGPRLWSSDGEEVTVVAELAIGSRNPASLQSMAAGTTLYLVQGPESGRPSPFGSPLWRTDGTAEGTELLNPVDSLNPPWRPLGYSTLLRGTQDEIYFSNLGRELWSCKSRPATPVRLADLGEGAQIVSLIASEETLWVTVDRGNSKELWTWSGGAANQVTQIPKGARSDDQLLAMGSGVVFRAGDAALGAKLWTSNGTVTRPIEGHESGSLPFFPSNLVRSGESLFFTGDLDGKPGLWVSDGIATWPVKLWDDGEHPTELVDCNGALCFLVGNEGQDLWRSDGTEAGTQPIAQIATADDAYGQRQLATFAGKLFFQGHDGHSGFELWSSDGTAPGTHMLWNLQGTRNGLIDVEPRGVAAWGNSFVFRGDDGIHGEEPWQTDGGVAGTTLLADVRAGPHGSDPARFRVAGSTLFFEAHDGVHGSELWRSNTSGTVLVKDFNPGGASAYLNGMSVVGNQLAFVAQGESTTSLWLADADRTIKIHEGVGNQMGTVGHALLFTATDSMHGEEPWWTDFTTTRQVRDLIAGPQGSSPGWFSAIGNEAYFQAYNGNGFRLWKTDGTAAGTTQVRGWDGPGAIYPLVAADNRWYFFEEVGDQGLKLWMAQDGVATLVRQIGEIGRRYPFDFPADPFVQACGELLFFVADDGEHGDELWFSDGTAAGTTLVRDIRPGPTGSGIVNLTVVGRSVFFQANDGVSGEELWVSNGTAAGTRLVADLVPGPGGSAPAQLTLAGNHLYFGATTDEFGHEPYRLEVQALLEYHQWAQAAKLAGLAATPNATPHGDGIANLLKFAFGIDGAAPWHGSPAGEPGHLPHFSVSPGDAGNILRVAYARRTGSSLIYTPMRSLNLAEGSYVPMAGEEHRQPLADGWERVVRSERIDGARCFGKIAVTLALE